MVLGRAGESGEGGAGEEHSSCALGEGGASAGVERGSEEGGRARVASRRLGEGSEGNTDIRDHMGRTSIGHVPRSPGADFLEYLPEMGAGPLVSCLRGRPAGAEAILGPCASRCIC